MNEFPNNIPENENIPEESVREETPINEDIPQPEENTFFETDSVQKEENSNQQESAPDMGAFPENEYSSAYNTVNFTPVNQKPPKTPASKGVKVFALIMAVIVLLTGSCLTGYFIGKSKVGISSGKNNNVNLAATPADTDEMTVAEVYDKVSPSIVGITIYNEEGTGGNATGIVFSEDGYIITNDHIYAEVPNAKFKIYTSDGNEYSAEYVAGDVISDLAVLKVDDVKLTPAVFGNSDEIFFGQNVAAIGNPNGSTEPSTITRGVISAVDCRVTGSTNYSSRLIQTDSAINPGNSGGALVNMYGQVIGVTSSKLVSSAYDNVGYAIPTTVMKRIVDELIGEGKVVSRAKLGITYTEVNSVTAELNDYSQVGLLIASVAEDSGLYGKASEGDFITHMNGIEVTTSRVVLDIIEQSRAGDTVSVTIVSQNGTSKTVDAVLAANEGESSYGSAAAGSSQNGGTFDFPQGE